MNLNPKKIAVIGLGRAGNARARAIEASPGVKLWGTISRREGFGSKTMGDAINAAELDAAIICVENKLHYEICRRFLCAGKHVAVEFPLTNRLMEAKELFTLAKENNRILHCELIGLLTVGHKHRKQSFEAAPVERLSCTFTGGLNGWVREEAEAGNHGVLACGRIAAAIDILGQLKLIDASLKTGKDQYELNAVFENKNGVLFELTETRELGRKRSTVWTEAETPAKPAEKSKPLFQQDLEAFVGQINGERKSYFSQPQLLSLCEIIEELQLRLSALG